MNDSIETKVTRTGVIGLGAMGLQMARHMAGKGFTVAGTDIDAAAIRGPRRTACAPARARPTSATMPRS